MCAWRNKPATARAVETSVSEFACGVPCVQPAGDGSVGTSEPYVQHNMKGKISVIHQYKSGGYNIVMDINSGSIHVVDDIVYGMIPLVEPLVNEGIKDAATIKAAVKSLSHISCPEEEMDEAVDEVLALESAGQLFSPDIYENFVKDFKNRQTVVKALCLHIAHDCNLSCKYCFAGEGEYHGRRALMTPEVGKKALDFLVESSGDRVNLEVDFFGGEPLMNWQTVKELVAYGRSLEKHHNKKFRFTLTTNGVLLDDEILEFANKEMANIVLSIDGRKSVHDKMRPFCGGQGSYDLIVPKFKKVAESRGQEKYYVRGTYTRNNLDFSQDVLHLADLGFKQISVEPVVARLSDDYAITEADLDVLKAEYDRLAAEMIKRKNQGKGFNFFHFMIDLSSGPCVVKRLSGCGSGTEYLAVTPWGDLYPCHQFVGNEKFLMGNVEEGILRKDIQEEFKCCNVYAKDKCKKCFAKFYCSGGCAANAYNFHGNLSDSYDVGCELERKRVECAILLKVAEQHEKIF